ncbi:3-isopropylmalate dehydratase small subunit [Rhodococcus sp. SORGH_AS_0301]|uniref:3-isopropylmalate dehydratase small subunit n=1 Tax=Rhodococcus sp. SORGH_AS_0301 TaxID=3041780 RepID=UPI0027839589|nr:3-isopropylmalate dehydratase small subunit [Rhodococcus sp. SORGH_AS_0301]MDQ1181822.1 3-isopropylmalate/(R)-2-methylmalate dehydratase small subunit [Rhodococcus sp. SORGH_AS_0301]
MQAFTTTTGTAVPLRRSRVDTDQICPSAYMKRVTRTGYEDALFSTWRTDPDFVLNRPPFDHGTILVTGPDFGIGSSREHAVWALMDFGFRVVVCSQFADIFRSNAGKSGLLAAQVEQADIELLWMHIENHPTDPVTVDLHTRIIITAGPLTVSFHVDDDTRNKLLDGLDDIDIALQHDDEISAFESRRPPWMPRTVL